jgi:hypothetical protein
MDGLLTKMLVGARPRSPRHGPPTSFPKAAAAGADPALVTRRNMRFRAKAGTQAGTQRVEVPEAATLNDLQRAVYAAFNDGAPHAGQAVVLSLNKRVGRR